MIFLFLKINIEISKLDPCYLFRLINIIISYVFHPFVVSLFIHFLGAAPGNVAESVILERESESTVMFVEGAKNAYAGHLTLKFSPDVTSTVPHHKHYCLEVGENCSPIIDHCIIRSTSVGKLLTDTTL